MTQNTPARRPGVEAKVGDIVQSQSGSNHALWKVEAVHDVPNYARPGTRRLLDLRSLKSGRVDRGRSALWLDVLSPEEVARIQAKRAPKALPLETLDAIADAIARWDYKTATGEEPDSDEDPVLPPHRELAGHIGRLVTGGAA